MSLDHILLGYLRKPATGYDLGREFEEGARHFWFAELSQIYPTLKRLESRGWLRGRDAPSARGPARRLYQITERGRTALRRWLLAGPHIGRDRLAYVAQTFFLDTLENEEEAAAVIRQMQAVWRQKLAHLEGIEAQIVADFGDSSRYPPDLFYPFSALRMGIHQYRAKLAWCEETLGRMDARAGQTSPVEVEA